MDGVAADFEKRCNELGLHPQVGKLERGIYESLEPIKPTVDGINRLVNAGIEVFMLTKIPSKNPWAASEKLLWLRKHLPKVGDHAVITPDKGCVGCYQDLLLDDHPEWANANQFRGKIITFDIARPYFAWAEVYQFFNITPDV